MLINLYQKSVDIVTQWLNITAASIISYRRPVRIPVRQPANLQQYGVNRNTRALYKKR